ncbi:putative HAD-superfamily hydrolase, subfamily IIA, HAD superfamily [Helianthus annuus]|nr:putative HAD-superfamily hydrolase, subfamily IIA, HAD superfamily [Helianthus annuus]
MKFRTVSRVLQHRNRSPSIQLHTYRLVAHLHSAPQRPSFGIAFDIDGVILRGRSPIGDSPKALKRLYDDDSGSLKIPYLFLTNGGGIPESRRASELSQLLGVNIDPIQVVQGHSPFKNLLTRFENELVVATGKGEPAAVMSEYGFKKAVSLDEYASYFDSIDPLAPYKTWTTKQPCNKQRNLSFDVASERVKAAFVVSDPVDWSRDIQVLCDILRSGGLPGEKSEHQPDMYFAADDLEYQAVFPSERLGMGAFRIALERIFNSIHHKPLKYTSFGKPNPFVFKNAESVLMQLQSLTSDADLNGDYKDKKSHHFETLYMIGDNPSVDIKGARQAGHPWFSILTRTGVFRGKENHSDYPADQVVDTVEEAVEFILQREFA